MRRGNTAPLKLKNAWGEEIQGRSALYPLTFEERKEPFILGKHCPKKDVRCARGGVEGTKREVKDCGSYPCIAGKGGGERPVGPDECRKQEIGRFLRSERKGGVETPLSLEPTLREGKPKGKEFLLSSRAAPKKRTITTNASHT